MEPINPNKFFLDNYYNIAQEDLISLNNKNRTDGLIRFFSGIENYVFGAFVPVDDSSDLEVVHLFYAQHLREFESFAIPVPLDYSEANELVFVFAREITLLNTEHDIFNVFNTLQHFRESSLEGLGYFTFNPFKTPKGGILITAGQLIAPVWKLERIDFLRDIFKDIIDKEHLDPQNKIYLMVDNTTGYIKIGKSKNPKYREGTLQSKQPETHLIAIWTAPSKIEKELHSKYSHKRKRGEWFHLTIEELDEIKLFMNSLS